MASLKSNDDFERGHHPTRYQLIDKDGEVFGLYGSALKAAAAGARLWPDQEQDEERTGKGWDVQVVGCDQ